MSRDPAATNRLSTLLAQLLSLTKSGKLRWERQLGRLGNYLDQLAKVRKAPPAKELKKNSS